MAVQHVIIGQDISSAHQHSTSLEARQCQEIADYDNEIAAAEIAAEMRMEELYA